MKNKKIKSIFFLLMLLISIGMIIRSEYVKSTLETKGKGFLQIANWAFNINLQGKSITNLNLANTSNSETDYIAPGDKGEFYIVIDANGSNVPVNYKVEFINEVNKPRNLQFIYNGNIKNNIKELESLLTGTIEEDEKEKTRKMIIQWEWKYESGETEEEKKEADKIDTIDGKNSGQYEFDIVITGTQKN